MTARKSTSLAKKGPARNEETFSVALSEYAAAMTPYQRRDWSEAQQAFQSFVRKHGDTTDASELVDRARVHGAACAAHLAPPANEPTSASDWTMRGVALANDGRCDDALNAFRQAKELGAPESRISYVSAAAFAIVNRNEEAIEQLARAIQIDPENRAFSLGDPDFERLREMAGYVALVEPPTAGPGARHDEELTDDAEFGAARLQIDPLEN